MKPFASLAVAILAASAAASVTACDTPMAPDDSQAYPAPVQSAITIAALGPELIRVSWETDGPTTGTVTVYDEGLRRIRETASQTIFNRHLVEVAGLRPRTGYSFSVTSQRTHGEAVTSALQAFTTPDMPPGPESELQVTRFEVLEYEYGGEWYYAPRVEVAEVSGRGRAIVHEMRFSVDGIGSIDYDTSKCVAPGEKRVLLNMGWDTYEVELSTVDRRATGQASVVLNYTDWFGVRATLTVTGTVVPSGLPDLGGGGALTWDCRE